MFALYLSRATAIFVIGCCQFGPRWLFGQKMELMACADLVGDTPEQSFFFLTFYNIINDMKHFQTVCIAPQPCHSCFCCCLLPIWPKFNFRAENGAYGLCRLGWQYNRANMYFSWPYMILSMIWKPLNCLHHISAVPQPFLLLMHVWAENGAYGLCRLGLWYNRAKLYFYWTCMILSMIWNTSEMSVLHLTCHSHFCCWLLPIWP